MGWHLAQIEAHLIIGTLGINLLAYYTVNILDLISRNSNSSSMVVAY